MIKEVKYMGYTAVPSDYECPDGDLATALGLVQEDGSLKPFEKPGTVGRMGLTRKKAIFVHKTNLICNYIFFDDGPDSFPDGKHELWYAKKGERADNGDLDINPVAQGIRFEKIYKVTSIGNTLIAATETGLHYFLWKAICYHYLGNHMPELTLSFGLQGTLEQSDEFTVSAGSTTISDLSVSELELSDDDKGPVTNAVLAQVNKFIAEKATGCGKFIMPFLVRYAYRLFDGTLSMHSTPILMVCATGVTPRVACFNGKEGNAKVSAITHELDYALVHEDEKSVLQDWKDIIQSVDVFISSPIYTYDQNGTIDRITRYAPSVFSICRLTGSAYYGMVPNGSTNGAWYIVLPQKDRSSVDASIKDCSIFYRLKSLKIDELSITRTKIEVSGDYLSSLASHEAMDDDFDSHDLLLPQTAFHYNQRLNLANLQKRVFNGFDAAAICFSNLPDEQYGALQTLRCYTHIKTDGREIIVAGEAATFGLRLDGGAWPPFYYYYPSSNAYKVTAVVDGTGYEIMLDNHGFLNGAVCLEWSRPTKTVTIPTLSTEEERTVNIQNKIYTSEVGNPFVFPVLGINTVGTGIVLGISSATKALSEGQFGQFPLYAFTSDGVWALEVSGEGLYSAKQPVTRDVCINADSITPADNAVLFTSDRGIMLLSGSDSICITESIKTDAPFQPEEDLPMFPAIRASWRVAKTSFLPSRQFLAGCGMIYDYVHQRLVVFNPACSYAYLYAFKSRAWSTVRANIANAINSYPEALAVTSDGTIVDFTVDSGTMDTPQIIVTRPLKLDTPNELKTVDTIIQRGYFRKGSVKSMLYGSRDLINWFPVWSSNDHYLRGFRGTSYKYFRIVVMAELHTSESLSGCTVQFTPRLTNRPR